MKKNRTKTWPCEHIVKIQCNPGYYWESKYFDIDGIRVIPDQFNFCPICGAKRPKGKKK